MVSRTRLLALLTALLLASLAAPSTADAARRKVPFGFFGTVLPAEMTNPSLVSDTAVEEQVGLMARSGVESLRITISWDAVEPAPGAYDWPVLDRLVASASRHRLSIVLNVTATPQWASERPDDVDWWRFPPRDPAAFAQFMRQLVMRYGPQGSFWAQNQSMPRVPIRQWQIWNEQTAPWHWEPQPWAPSYTRLLKAAYRAIHGGDRGAKVIAGSLVAARADYAPWDAIRDLYRAGAKRFFDVIAVHPFTHNARSVRATLWQLLEMVRRVRVHMRRHGDGGKPVILTEMTWPAAVGRIPRNALLGLETTARGQALRLKAAYRRLARERRKLRVTQAYWYAWASQYDTNSSPSVMSFRFTGLTRFSDGAFSVMPILRTYASVAARYQGCRKSSNARRCR